MMRKISEKIIASLECSDDAKKWYQDQGIYFIQKLGISTGYSVLDFGCRIGHYSIPTAIIVGLNGYVYALDKDKASLDQLMRNAKKLSLNNIIYPIITKGELTINLSNNSMDAVFLYDVIHIILHIDGTLKPLKLLLGEIYRILKSKGLLSVSIEHLDKINHSKQEIIKEIQNLFIFKEILREEIMHWDWLKIGQVVNFKKE